MTTRARPRAGEEPFEQRLRAGLDRLASETPVRSPGRFEPTDVSMVARTDPSRRRRPLLVAAAVVVVTAAGLAALSRRGDQTIPAGPTTPADVVAPSRAAPGGAMIVDDLPDSLADATITVGGRMEAIDTSAQSDGWGPVRRWYTTSVTQPERQPWIAVDSFEATAMPRDVVGSVEQIRVRGVVAEVYDDPLLDARSIAFTLEGTTYVVTGSNLSDEDVMLAVEHVRPADDGYGAVIDAAGLTNGLVERTAGTLFEAWFTSRQSLDAPAPELRVDAAGATAWLVANAEDPTLLAVHRLSVATTSHTTVRGVPGLITTLDVQPEYRGLTWHEDGVTYQLGSNHLGDAGVFELAERLRPATLDEWQELVASTERVERDVVDRLPVGPTIPAPPASP